MAVQKILYAADDSPTVITEAQAVVATAAADDLQRSQDKTQTTTGERVKECHCTAGPCVASNERLR